MPPSVRDGGADAREREGERQREGGAGAGGMLGKRERGLASGIETARNNKRGEGLKPGTETASWAETSKAGAAAGLHTQTHIRTSLVSRVLSGAAVTPYGGAGVEGGKRRGVDYHQLPLLWEGFLKMPASASGCSSGSLPGRETETEIETEAETETETETETGRQRGRE